MKEITQEDLRDRLVNGDPITVLDIREANEFADWHIHGSINLPVYNALNSGGEAQVSEKLKSAPLDQKKPVAVVCRMGHTSKMAAYMLDKMGYQAASVAGGIYGWSGAWTEARIPLKAAKNGTLFQVRRNGKGCLSYLFGSKNQAAVIDPCVEPRVYAHIASREDLSLTHVIETHVHADHISRARALCKETGATLVVPANDRVAFEYRPLRDTEVLEIGDVSMKVIATPGHTTESACYELDGAVLLSGDTIFVDTIGRPDLERGDSGAEAGARTLYDSLHTRVMTLDPDMMVCPGHTSEPIGFDGKPIAARLADIIAKVDLLRLDRDTFARTIPDLLGQKPPNFKRVISVNEGKTDLGWLDPLELEAGPNRCAVK
jgi:glyoxylase-like metal-dependent hydrolase (beta-lactamase superfamily II)